MEEKTNCFAYNVERHCCNVLTELVCHNKECKFYKTREQFDREVKNLPEREE